LGRGGFSEVWLVEDTKVENKRMALKIYAPGYGLDSDGIKLFSDEFILVCDLNHTNLLRTSHYDICNLNPYLIMPYCDRGSAKKLTGNITEEEAWKFLFDVASGLSYLHDRETPIIHQDIKPDVQILHESKSDIRNIFGATSLSKYADIVLSMYRDDSENIFSLIESWNTTINELQAVVLDGKMTIANEETETRYIVTVIEGEHRFYQLVVFVHSGYYASRTEIIDKIMNSFNEL
jgi:serine/threonine protein kinase